MGYSFIFCIFISTAFCDEGAQLLMQKDTPLESLPSNDNSVNPLNDDGLKVDEAKAEDMASISMKTVEDVMENDSAKPVNVEAKAEDMPSISMKTVEDVMENDSAKPVSDEANPSINSDYVSNVPADDNVKIDNDNVGDDNNDIIDDNKGISDDSDDVDDEDDDLNGEYYGVDDEDDDVDNEDDDVDDEDDEELVYHYIVNDQEPNNDEQITEL